MLQSENRLTKVRDFNLLMKYGHWISGQFLDIKVLDLARAIAYFPPKEDPDNFKKQLKLAFAVGLKISKSAVKRNRTKRQVREVVRLLLKDQRLKGGQYLLFVAKKGILEKNYAELSQEVQLLLNKGKLLQSL